MSDLTVCLGLILLLCLFFFLSPSRSQIWGWGADTRMPVKNSAPLVSGETKRLEPNEVVLAETEADQEAQSCVWGPEAWIYCCGR